MLTLLSILSGLAAPAVNDFVGLAKLVRAEHDVRTIAVALIRMTSDVGAQGDAPRGWTTSDLLVGAGEAPSTGGLHSRRWGANANNAGLGLLDDHLVTNAANYMTYTPATRIGWRGAYLQDRTKADPWGTRYAVNVGAMRDPHNDIVVHTAGPDGRVDVPFEADGFASAGDDIIAVVASAGHTR